MWGQKHSGADGAGQAQKHAQKPADTEAARPGRLREALREARQEAADRKDVVVDLRDAEFIRLELLNEALDPVFADMPPGIDLFDRAISRGDTPRLWIDLSAHVAMGRDKRQYRFLRDTRLGRSVIAETYEIPEMVEAITHYVARRLVERDQVLSGALPAPAPRRRGIGGVIAAFVLGFAGGMAALAAAALVFAR